MHEVSIMAEAVRMAVESAQAAGARRVTGLRLRVGTLSGVVPDALQFAFEAMAAGTLAENATLTIESIPARFWCEACQREFEAAQLFAECPQCNTSSREPATRQRRTHRLSARNSNPTQLPRPGITWPSPNLTILGGLYLPDYQATVGPQTLVQLQELMADKVFLGTDGLTLGSGATTANVFMAEVDRMMVERSRQVILVTDSSKIGRVGFVPVKPVSAFHMLITDTNAPPDIVQSIRDMGVEVILV